MKIIFYFIIFVFGACVGSFLNCVVYRLKQRKKFLKGRSFCPQCKNVLQWYDLIPILSFVMLRGKCRYCKKQISWQYPMVEIATGVLLILNFKFLILNQFSIFNFKTLITLGYLWIVSALLIIIFVYDLKHFIIPDKVVYPAIGVSVAYNIWLYSGGALAGKNFWHLLLSALLAAGFFFLLWLFSQGKWMGFGDVKLAFLMGVFLGFPNVLVGLFFGFLVGAIIGLGLMAAGKKGLKSEVPFGPFLVAGTFVALFLGKKLITWYLAFS